MSVNMIAASLRCSVFSEGTNEFKPERAGNETASSQLLRSPLGLASTSSFATARRLLIPSRAREGMPAKDQAPFILVSDVGRSRNIRHSRNIRSIACGDCGDCCAFFRSREEGEPCKPTRIRKGVAGPVLSGPKEPSVLQILASF